MPVYHNIRTKGGNTLSVFYNPDIDLLVVDLISSDEKTGNEIVRMAIDEAKLLAHAPKPRETKYKAKARGLV